MKRYIEKPQQVKLGDDGYYKPLHLDSSTQFISYIRLLKAHKMCYEAQILTNLRNARSNYQWACAKRAKGKNVKTGAYTTSLKKAIVAAQKLAKSLQEDPAYPLLTSTNIIGHYIEQNCRLKH